MPDDVTLPGTGVVIASDDVGGVQYQKVKLIDSADGSSTPVGTTANPLKVAEIEADCVTLLSTSLTTTGPTSSIDTTGYGAVVVQISGSWVGFINAEASNDGTTWDTIMVLSRDSLNLQDMITSGGLYTIRPSGKFVRLNVAQISGTATVVAIGREAEGISAADLLSLAMDEANLTPLGVKLYGAQGRAVPQDGASGALMARLVDRQYMGVSFASGTVMFTAPCDDMNYILLTMVASTTASFQVETLLPDGSWQAVFVQSNGATVSTVQGSSISSSGTQAVFATAHLGGASWVRARSTTGGTIRVMAKLTNTPPPAMLPAFQAINSTAANAQCTNTPLTPTAATNLTSAATTNATSVKASAGRIFVLSATNNGAAVCFLKLYNKASAPTVGTDVPVQVMSIPANGVPLMLEFGALGLQFTTGIAYAITNLIGDADTTAIAANQVKLMMSYV